jgi:hypothetical protein
MSFGGKTPPGSLAEGEAGMAWKVKVARGQKEYALPVVQQAYREQQQFPDRQAAFVLVAQAHLTHAMSFSDNAFYQNARSDDSMRCSLRALAGFLSTLDDEAYDGVTLVYVRIAGYLNTFAPRPTVEAMDAADVLVGVRMFCTAVEQSGGDSGHPERQCEWVVISCDRIP